jgi:hypothetical protein
MGCISNFLNDTIEAIHSTRYRMVPYTEDDVISVSIGCDVITWECFKNSAKDLDWDPTCWTRYIRDDILICLPHHILYLEECDDDLRWLSFDKVSEEHDESITYINLRPNNYKEDW